jgi:hypothetical protein
MPTKITSLVVAMLCCLPGQAISAQRIAVAVESIEHFDPYFEDIAGEIEDFVAQQLTKNNALRVVERTDFSGIVDEQERQKSEGFIDGEVVDQGKLVGAQLVVRFEYDEDNESLRLQVVGIASGEILCSENYSTEVGADDKLPETIWEVMKTNLHGCFQQYNAPAAAPLQVIEILGAEAGGTRLLVYSEDTKSTQSGTRLSIYTVTKKKVGDKEVDYPKQVGVFLVEEVENKNFLNGKVLEGSEAIRSLLIEESQLYAKPIQ